MPARKEAKTGSGKSRFLLAAPRASWDRCVTQVKRKGLVDSPYAVCTARVGAPAKAKKETKPKTETQASSPALDRAKEATAAPRSHLDCRFLESDQKQGNRFKAILIQEGLGNLKDGYYYTKEALQSAVAVFQGKKFFADHPSADEDQNRPERSVLDVYGYFENLAYQEAQDGTGQLLGEIVVLPNEGSDHVRALLMEAVAYAQKFPDKSLVGLSINASGDAETIDAQDFLNSGRVTQSAIPKIQQAMQEGLTQIKVVKLIDSAVSCDLVTEAGAKGKVLELLEADKKMAKQAKQEAEEKKNEAEEKKAQEAKDGASDKGDSDGAAADHDDEEQDKALIMDQLKKHGLIKDDSEDGDKAEAEEGEEKKEAGAGKEEEAEAHVMKAAKHMHQAFKKMGMKSADAAESAAKAMKASNMAHESMEAEEKGCAEDEEKKEAKKEAEEKKEKKESAAVIKLQGEKAQLLERLAKLECEKHLETKLRESKLPMSVTKKFKESIKTPKSVKDIDEKFNLFMEGYRATGGEAGLGEFIMTEKETATEAGALNLADFVEE